MTKLGIIEAGNVDQTLSQEHGTYSDMLLNWLKPILKPKSSLSILIYKNEILPLPTEADLWIISGSKYGVYDKLPWLNPLRKFIIECHNKAVPMLGICFGHQIISEALGGQVIKSEKGWGIGIQKYMVNQNVSWLKNLNKIAPADTLLHYKGFAFHQDQVVKIPRNCIRIAGNDFCPNALLAYGNLSSPNIVTIQNHPEFSRTYFKDLSILRKGKPIPSYLVISALQDLDCELYNKSLALSLTNALLK